MPQRKSAGSKATSTRVCGVIWITGRASVLHDAPHDACVGVVSFIQRFGSSLNPHLHLHLHLQTCWP